jgi:hypothetical protein
MKISKRVMTVAPSGISSKNWGGDLHRLNLFAPTGGTGGRKRDLYDPSDSVGEAAAGMGAVVLVALSPRTLRVGVPPALGKGRRLGLGLPGELFYQALKFCDTLLLRFDLCGEPFVLTSKAAYLGEKLVIGGPCGDDRPPVRRLRPEDPGTPRE